VRAAEGLAVTAKLTQEQASWLLTDLVQAPETPEELRLRAARVAVQRMTGGALVSVLAGFCADPRQREAVRRIVARLDESLLRAVLVELLSEGEGPRLAPSTLLREVDFPGEAWDLVHDDRRQANVLWLTLLYQMGPRVAQDPRITVRVALAKVLSRAPAGSWRKLVDAMRADSSPEVRAALPAQVPAATPSAEAHGGSGQTPQSRAHGALAPGVSAATGTNGSQAKGAENPAAVEAKPAVPPAKPSGPYGGKKPEVALFRARAAALRELRGREWFRVGFAVSREHRKRFEELVRAAAESGVRPQLQEESFPPLVPLAVTAPGQETPIFLNGVFVGRAPIAGLRVPRDTYTVTALGLGRSASREVKVEAASETGFSEEDFKPGDSLPRPPPDAAELAAPAWWQPVEARNVGGVVAVPGGVAVLSAKDGNPELRLYERGTGITLWEVGIGLAPTSPVVRRGGRLYWGAVDAMLHVIELEGGAASTVAALDGTLELAPGITEGSIVCPTWDAAEGGKVAAVDPESGEKRWTVSTDGRPVKLLVLGGAVVVASAGPGGGGRLVCLRAGDGRELWGLQLHRVEGMLLAGSSSSLFLRDGAEGSAAAFLDPVSGAPLLSLVTGDGAVVTDVLMSADRAAVATSDARLSLVDLASRSVRWSRSLPGSNAREVRLLDAATDAISVIAGGVRPSDAGEAREGFLRLVSPRTGATLYKVGLSLRDAPAALGDGRMLISDLDGEIAVRDLARGWTPLDYSTLADRAGKDALRTVELDQAVYVVSLLRNRLYAFDLREEKPGASAPGARP
jgi:outer membrane protein assembly factor BamB